MGLQDSISPARRIHKLVLAILDGTKQNSALLKFLRERSDLLMTNTIYRRGLLHEIVAYGLDYQLIDDISDLITEFSALEGLSLEEENILRESYVFAPAEKYFNLFDDLFWRENPLDYYLALERFSHMDPVSFIEESKILNFLSLTAPIRSSDISKYSFERGYLALYRYIRDVTNDPFPFRKLRGMDTPYPNFRFYHPFVIASWIREDPRRQRYLEEHFPPEFAVSQRNLRRIIFSGVGRS